MGTIRYGSSARQLHGKKQEVVYRNGMTALAQPRGKKQEVVYRYG